MEKNLLENLFLKEIEEKNFSKILNCLLSP